MVSLGNNNLTLYLFNVLDIFAICMNTWTLVTQSFRHWYIARHNSTFLHMAVVETVGVTIKGDAATPSRFFRLMKAQDRDIRVSQGVSFDHLMTWKQQYGTGKNLVNINNWTTSYCKDAGGTIDWIRSSYIIWWNKSGHLSLHSPQSMLTNHQRCSVAFTWDQFYKKWS